MNWWSNLYLSFFHKDHECSTDLYIGCWGSPPFLLSHFYRHKMGSFEHWLDIWEEAEVAGNEVWRVGWVFKHSNIFIIASQTMCYGLARCPRAKSTRFSIIPVVSFSRVHAISSRLQCNTADLPSGRWVPTLPSQYPWYQRKQLCVDGLGDHQLSRFLCLPKIVCAI